MPLSTLPDLPVYLNGEYTSMQHAKISVMDRGFIFGDGIYEVVPVYGGKPFRLQHHLDRMARSLAETRMTNPHTREEWIAIATKLIATLTSKPKSATENDATGAFNHLVYFQITRGVAMRDHVMTEGVTPTVFAYVQPLKATTAAQREQGVVCVTAEDFRWKKAHIKSTSLLGAVFSRQISADEGALETIMFRDKQLSEAAASNVWVVQGGKVFGPKLDQMVLEGIRYGLIQELCASLGIPFELRNITQDEVFAADELILSSATKEVLPVVKLDSNAIGNGKPGPVFKRLYDAYQLAKAV